MVPEMHAFDEMTKGVAEGTISRRKALALAGGAALSAALVPFAAPADAGRRRRNRCKGKPVVCRSGTVESVCDRPRNQQRQCFCMKREPDGRKVCVNLVGVDCPTKDECDDSRDCPGSQVCVSLRGGACCPDPAQQRRSVCARNCPRINKRAGGKGGRTPLLR